MDFMMNFEPAKQSSLISYRDKILLMGSCFTEHIGNALADARFSLLQNPNGILFDTHSVCRSLVDYTTNKQYDESELFRLNEVWNSWFHHSRFSDTDKMEALKRINGLQQVAHHFVKEADWVIITLGSSFSYRITDTGKKEGAFVDEGTPVANCHRAPAAWFRKHMMTIQESIESLDGCLHRLWQFNPRLKFIFTVSPVRHLRDGVVENNRSKARLIETVHHLVNKFENLYYFPAYELVIDVLRDYRFYDIDFAHPNYLATEFVLKKFMRACLDGETQQLMEEMKKISLARRHKPFQPATSAHKQFLKSSAAKAEELQKRYPFLNLKEDLDYFNAAQKISE